MTSVHPPKLLSIEDWDALPEDNGAHIELQEGVLIVTPRRLRPLRGPRFALQSNSMINCPTISKRLSSSRSVSMPPTHQRSAFRMS